MAHPEVSVSLSADDSIKLSNNFPDFDAEKRGDVCNLSDVEPPGKIISSTVFFGTLFILFLYLAPFNWTQYTPERDPFSDGLMYGVCIDAVGASCTAFTQEAVRSCAVINLSLVSRINTYSNYKYLSYGVVFVRPQAPPEHSVRKRS